MAYSKHTSNIKTGLPVRSTDIKEMDDQIYENTTNIEDIDAKFDHLKQIILNTFRTLKTYFQEEGQIGIVAVLDQAILDIDELG